MIHIDLSGRDYLGGILAKQINNPYFIACKTFSSHTTSNFHSNQNSVTYMLLLSLLLRKINSLED